MKRLVPLALGALVLVGVACAPRNGKPTVSAYTAGIGRTHFDGTFTTVDGLAVNHSSNTPLDIDVELKASSGETSDGFVLNVFKYQTGAWSALFKGNVTVKIVRVTADVSFDPQPVVAWRSITAQQRDGTFTTVDGIIKNLGKATASYELELQATTGEVEYAFANDVLVGQIATWSALFEGTTTAKIIRVTSA